MKPIVAVMRRPFVLLMLLAALAVAGILAMSKMGADNSFADYFGMKEFIGGKSKSHADEHDESKYENQIVVTSPKVQDVIITESFVCQIRSQRHIEVRALEGGYLEKIAIKEGQAVKKGDVMFKILPILYKARLDAENAKAKVAQLKYKYTQQLVEKKVVSPE